MKMTFSKIEPADIPVFKKDIQEAFQKGFEDVFGKCEETILPERDIDSSLYEKGSAAYKMGANGKIVGGAVVAINGETQHNHLDLLYVKYGTQSKGIGFAIWQKIEELYPETKIWETCTPYFDRRNIHFYVNKCKFHIIEFQCEQNSGTENEDFIGDGGEGMFVFRKEMK